MGGYFGVASKKSCTMDLFFGTDYHSHLGTKRGGMAVFGENGFQRIIHNIENTPFRTKFDHDLDELEGIRQCFMEEFLTLLQAFQKNDKAKAKSKRMGIFILDVFFSILFISYAFK